MGHGGWGRQSTCRMECQHHLRQWYHLHDHGANPVFKDDTIILDISRYGVIDSRDFNDTFRWCTLEIVLLTGPYNYSYME